MVAEMAAIAVVMLPIQLVVVAEPVDTVDLVV
jgi:hypothetical protein